MIIKASKNGHNYTIDALKSTPALKMCAMHLTSCGHWIVYPK